MGDDRPSADQRLPVLVPGIAHPCGEETDSARCEECVVKWIERRAEAEGVRPDETTTHVVLIVPVRGLRSEGHRRRLRRRLRTLDIEAVLPSSDDRIFMRFPRATCPLHAVAERLEGLGYTLELEATEVRYGQGLDDLPRGGSSGILRLVDGIGFAGRAILHDRDLLLVSISGLLLLAGFIVHLAGGSDIIRLSLLALSAMMSSTSTFVDAIDTLKRFRVDVDVLMFVAAIGAAALGHYEEGAFLLFLFGLGSAGEHLALERAKRAVDALTDLAPDTADRIEPDGSTNRVPVEELVVGDHVAVHPSTSRR